MIGELLESLRGLNKPEGRQRWEVERRDEGKRWRWRNLLFGTSFQGMRQLINERESNWRQCERETRKRLEAEAALPEEEHHDWGRRWTLWLDCAPGAVWKVAAPKPPEQFGAGIEAVQVMPVTEHEQRVGELQARAENAEADYQALREAVEGEVERFERIARKAESEAAQTTSISRMERCEGQASMARAAAAYLATILGEGGKRLEDWEQDEARKLAADLQMVWLIRVKNVLEPKALLCLDPDQARGWQETGAEVVPYVPAGKPSPDCKGRGS